MTKDLLEAAKYVLRQIDNHQVYDKDARSILQAAIERAEDNPPSPDLDSISAVLKAFNTINLRLRREECQRIFGKSTGEHLWYKLVKKGMLSWWCGLDLANRRKFAGALRELIEQEGYLED